jgi:hypothetical protein
MKDEARLRRFAASANATVEEVRALEDRLRAMPMELFLARLGFAPEEIVYDPIAQVWIIPDRQYKGANTGILVIRQDKSFICVEIDRKNLS